MDALEVGTRIGDRYVIVGSLGAGGMGVVYRARDEKLGRLVALKTLPGERLGDREARARLLREARSAAALEHPNIAQVYDVGETGDGGAFLVMELVRGQSLRALLDRRALSREALLGILDQVADALDFAHKAGVVHRDVKPDNVMVREDGRAVLLDFGIAKDLGLGLADTAGPDGADGAADTAQVTREGTLLGTLAYIAPEQARGADVGPWSDQFALAVTAYEALAGRLPFVGESAASVLAQILVDPAPPPSEVGPTLSPAVDPVLARGLAKDRRERFESARAFTDALRAALERAPVPSRGSGTSRALLWVAPLALAAVAAGLAYSLLPEEPPAAAAAPAVIACPVLEARGVDAPTSWLGAMGADLVCRRLVWRLGGDPARARVPAALLGLPAVAGEDFPEDPFGDPEARTRTLAAAREAGVWIDGSVEREDDGTMVVALTLETPGGALARGAGRSRALYEAIGTATDALLGAVPFPVPGAIDPELAPWVGTSSVRGAVLFDELGEATLAGYGVEARCRSLLALAPEEIGVFAGEARRVCMRGGVEGAEALTRPALDRSSAAALALTAPEHGRDLEEAELRAIAEQLMEARDEAPSPFARAVLTRGAVSLYELLDEPDRVRDLLLTAAPDLPHDWFLRVHLVRALLRTGGQRAAVRALAAWHPGTPEAWRTLALPDLADGARAVPWLERAYLSGGTLPLHGVYLADVLLRLGRHDDVRVIAARYATGDADARLAGEYLRARLEIDAGRFGAAFDRLSAALARLPRLGRFVDGDTEALTWLLLLAETLGRVEDAAAPVVRRFVLAEPHRLVVDQPHYEVPVIHLCMRARPEVARPCLARLRELRAGRAARAGRVDGAAQLLEGAEHAVAEEWSLAARAWRPLLRTRLGVLDPVVFERAGEPAIVERIERVQLAADSLAGAHPVHVREARRAAARGDHERAREMAARVIDAWSATDVPVPAVEEMRSLLASLPPPVP